MFTSFNKYSKQIAIALLATSMFTFSSCSKDDDVTEEITQEITSFDYNFSNASYTGQLERIALLEELSVKAKGASAEKTIVTAADLQTLFSKTSDGGKQLENKTDSEGATKIKTWFDALETASKSEVSAEDGKAGRLSKSETSAYLYTSTGLEPAQLIEKGIMGACFYFQATGIDGYLSSTNQGEGLLVDNTTNVEGKDYTSLQHHWDEAFGYFGAPTTLTNLTTDGAKFHAKYSLKGENGGLNITNDIMKAFYLGRKAIDDKNLEEAKKQALIVKEKWELTIVAAAIHYLNGAGSTSFTSNVDRLHKLSEARAFIWSLNFNEDKKISSSQINEVLNLLGENFWTVTKTDIENTSKKLAEYYGINEASRLAL